MKVRQQVLFLSQGILRQFGYLLPRRLRFNLMYMGSPPWDTGITPPELATFITHHLPGRAIDLGCGTGTNLIALARAGWQVTGVDFAERAVQEARQKLDHEGIKGEVRAGDVTDLNVVQGEYDLVLDIGCYHSLPEVERAAYQANLIRILAPGGWFLVYAHWGSSDRDDGTGISDCDIKAFQQILLFEDRQDSQDRWGRSASWMCFRRAMIE